MTTRADEVLVPAGDVTLAGMLGLPDGARGVVLFAHGSGSGRHSPRNQYVARFLESRGLGTLLIDLLSAAEEEAERWTRHLRFDIDLLAGRLVAATEWLRRDGRTRSLPLGYFGASTGAAAALVAAAQPPAPVRAVVSRGGRPDLAGDHLPHVRCPTLLIVGADDVPVISMNREALRMLRCDKRLEIVPGATHLFEEPGTLEIVAELATDWFGQHMESPLRERPEEASGWPP
jgi:putative phosphoribosyl transferase